jgi:SAM-dependent methyltransferase
VIATHRSNFRWYGFVYRTVYLLGLRIWEREDPAAELVALIEGPDAPPLGRALDIGCGTGTDSVYLATRGWEVTGVDMVPRALAAARRRAVAAGVSPRYVEGDATRLPELGLDGDFALLLDFGCFHTLPLDQREPYVESVSAVAAPEATLLLYGFARPPRLAPMYAGLTPDEVRERFGRRGWQVVSAERVSANAIEVSGRRVDEQFELLCCRLRHPT